MSWSAPEVETILAQMRAGATAGSGGSRCHTTYFFRDGAWGYEDFDEGHTSLHSVTEAWIRDLITRAPERFRGILKSAKWRPFVAAFVAGEREAARQHLRAALVYGDQHEQGKILDALLAWPDTPPSEEVGGLIRSKMRGFTAYHVIMAATGWDQSPAGGALGVATVNQLIEMVGEARGCYYLRASFYSHAGEFEAAERDLLVEIERCAGEDANEQYYRDSLERLHARASESAVPVSQS